MIQEQKKVTISELAKVCSQLVSAERYSRDMSLYYLRLFNHHVDCDPDSIVPYSPLTELYQRLSEYYAVQMLSLGQRINQLQEIADTTLFIGLDY
jgi:hypothetical protein